VLLSRHSALPAVQPHKPVEAMQLGVEPAHVA
jgi:hypothetical protein